MEVRIRNSSGKLVNAVFTELNPKEDSKRIKKIPMLWSEKAQYSENLAEFFDVERKDYKNDFFALELLNKVYDASEKILGLLKLDFLPDNKIKITALQARPDCIYSADTQRKFSGVGANCLAGVFNIAKGRGVEQVNLYSSNNKFYNTAFQAAEDFHKKNGGNSEPGFIFSDERGIFTFEINNHFFDKYINYMKHKYRY